MLEFQSFSNLEDIPFTGHVHGVYNEKSLDWQQVRWPQIYWQSPPGPFEKKQIISFQKLGWFFFLLFPLNSVD